MILLILSQNLINIRCVEYLEPIPWHKLFFNFVKKNLFVYKQIFYTKFLITTPKM